MKSFMETGPHVVVLESTVEYPGSDPGAEVPELYSSAGSPLNLSGGVPNSRYPVAIAAGRRFQRH